MTVPRLWSLLVATVLVAACRDAARPTTPAPASDLLPGVNLPPLAVAGGPYLGDGLIRFDGSASTDPDGTGPLTYAWDFGDGERGAGVAPTHSYLADGVYAVTLTVTDSSGARSLPAATVVSISNSDGPAVVVTGAGNIARCATHAGEATANLLDVIPGTVVALGDNALPYGRLADYQGCYAPTWGRHLARTWAAIGNHEYDSSSTAAGAVGYFGNRAGANGLGYYSFNVGAWHVIVLNDNAAFVPFAAGTAQEQWLKADLAANSARCTMAIWHTPLFLSSNTAGYTTNSTRKVLWDDLYAAGADVVLNAHQHHYERMAPMRPDGTVDGAQGIKQFNVGTGGDGVIMPTVTIHPNSEVRSIAYGVLRLTLRATRYDWEFVPVAGESFQDAGSGTCH